MNTQTQQPVAWTTDNQLDWLANKNNNTSIMWNNNNRIKMGIKQECKIIPLYTHPAPSWQGLESEKVTQIIHGLEDKLGMPIVGAIAVARSIEQELKKKNA